MIVSDPLMSITFDSKPDMYWKFVAPPNGSIITVGRPPVYV
jgi:hypothetical protein